MTPTRSVELRGYAIPFNRASPVGEVFEYADQESFAAYVAGRAKPSLNFREHDGETIGRIEELFIDDFGLGFRATISQTTWDDIKWLVCCRDQQHSLSYCSVFLSNLKTERAMFNNDDRVFRRISAASIDHITICDRTAVYQDTGVWPAQIVGTMPPRLALMAERWARGYGLHRAAIQAAKREVQAETARLASLASVAFEPYDQFRARALAALTLGRAP